MHKDPIVEMVRKVREKQAAKFNYDLKEQERRSDCNYFVITCKTANKGNQNKNQGNPLNSFWDSLFLKEGLREIL